MSFRWSILLLFVTCTQIEANPLRNRPLLRRTNHKLAGEVLDYTKNHGQDNRIWSNALCEKRDLYVYLPPCYDHRKAYPLVIWLHGSGQSGSDNTSQMGGATGVFTKAANQESRPCFVLAPQCPDATVGWRNEVAQNLMALIADLTDKLPIDQGRIYLTGSSMGGSGTFLGFDIHGGVFSARSTANLGSVERLRNPSPFGTTSCRLDALLSPTPFHALFPVSFHPLSTRIHDSSHRRFRS